MKTSRFLLVFVLLAASATQACLNRAETVPDLQGVTLEGSYTTLPGSNLAPRLYILKDALRDSPSRKFHSWHNNNAPDSEAFRDIVSGRYEDAIAKLLEMEAAQPGEYETAANLGTAYELAGDNENALHWISEGIKRNEYSHMGTEWLHKKILETKIAMNGDAAYLETHPILPFPESTTWQTEFTFDYDGRTYSVDELIEALHYQLGERMVFVKPQDPIVADLLYSFATLAANTRFLEPAVELLDLAKTYGYHNTTALEEKRARYQDIIDSTWIFTWDGFANTVFLSGIVWLLFVLPPVAYYLHWRRRRRDIQLLSALSNDAEQPIKPSET